MRASLCILCVLSACANGKIESETAESGDDSGENNLTTSQTKISDDVEESEERIGASVTQVSRHPYSGALLSNNSYVCSSIILNQYWMLTLSKCFDTVVISSYVSHKYLGNYSMRVGSNYNNKGGSLYKIKLLFNNFDLKVSAVKLTSTLSYDNHVRPVVLPNMHDEVSLGRLTTIMAWTPTGHLRVVNAPVIDPTICETSTKLLPGHYVCVGGVQDPNRHFCRKDNGGAVIQNNTLVAVSSFLHTCALYTKTHAFPKAASFTRWLDGVIWDENNRPTTETPKTTKKQQQETQTVDNTTQPNNRTPYLSDPRKFMLTLPFDPVNVPLEPAEDNSVIPRMSLYESYLQNFVKVKTTTTESSVDAKRAWFEKFGKSMIMKQMYPNKYQ